MKLFGFELIDNRRGNLTVIDIEKRIKEVYIKEGNEAAYATYRAITGADVKGSWEVVKPWIKVWGGQSK